MFETIRNWYKGEVKIHKNVVGIYTKRHWSAKVARYIVNFYLKNWKWLWSAFFGLVLGYIKLLQGNI